jgi:hypothetical protein
MSTIEQEKASGLAAALARVQANLPTIEKSKTATVSMKAVAPTPTSMQIWPMPSKDLPAAC